MLRKTLVSAIVGLCLVAALPALAQNSDVRSITRTVTLPVDQSEVTLTLKALSDMFVNQIYFDNTGTGTSNLCSADWSVIPPECTTGKATFEVSAIRIGGVFYKTGNTPYVFSANDKLALFSLFGAAIDEENPMLIQKNTTLQITLRVSDYYNNIAPENDIIVKATFGVTGGTGLSLTTETGPVNP